jgi:hypothetical protein
MTNLTSIQFTSNGLILIGKDGEIQLLHSSNRNNPSVIVLNNNAVIAVDMNGAVMAPGTEQHTNILSSVANSNFSASSLVTEPVETVDGNCHYFTSAGTCVSVKAYTGWCSYPWVAEPPCP